MTVKHKEQAEGQGAVIFEGNQGPATPGTAARCEVCNRDLAAEPHDAFDAQCSRDGIWRLKAENASLLESLRAAEQLAESRGRMLSDSMALHEKANRDLFAAEQRAEAAEKRIEQQDSAIADLNRFGIAKCAERDAAEKRAADLEAALRDVYRRMADSSTSPTEDEAFIRAALHDEERSDG